MKITASTSLKTINKIIVRLEDQLEKATFEDQKAKIRHQQSQLAALIKARQGGLFAQRISIPKKRQRELGIIPPVNQIQKQESTLQ